MNDSIKKYLVTIEFRYLDSVKDEIFSCNKNKTITICIEDSFIEACNKGNKALEKFEARFKLNPNHNKKERFSLNGGAFRSRKTLITNLAYLTCPFDFYAKIKTLYFEDVDKTINEVLEAKKRYNKYNNEKEY